MAVIKAKDSGNLQQGRMAESAAKVVKALNNKKQPQGVPRSILELSKANDAFQQAEVKLAQTDPKSKSDPVATNALAKAVVDIEDASDRFQEINELLQQYVNNVLANTQKAIACRKADQGFANKDLAKRRSSSRKHGEDNKSLERGGDDDSVEKYYYSEFTEGSAQGRQEIDPKLQHQRKHNRHDSIKGLPSEENNEEGPKSGTGYKEEQKVHLGDGTTLDGRKSKDLNFRKSQLLLVEEKLMNEQENQENTNKQPTRYTTLKDEADRDNSNRDRYNKNPDSDDDRRFRPGQGASARNNANDSENENHRKSIEYDSDDVDHLLHDSENVTKPASGQDQKGRRTSDFKPTDKGSKTHDHEYSSEQRNDRQPTDEEGSLNRDSNPKNGNKSKGFDEERQDDFSYVPSKPGKGKTESSEYIETASKKFDKTKSDNPESNPHNDKYEYTETADRRFDKNPEEGYGSEDDQKNRVKEDPSDTNSKNPDGKKETIETASRRFNNLRNEDEKNPIYREDDDYDETSSKKGTNDPKSKETLETAYRRKSKGPETDDARITSKLDNFNYQKNSKDGSPENAFKTDEEVTKKPSGSNKPESQNNTQGRKSTIKTSTYDEKEPIIRGVREGEIIVAELEEGKSGASKIRFSIVDSQGQKTPIDTRHMINPQSEFGEEFYKSITSSKKSGGDVHSNPKKQADPIASAMEERKSIVRDRLVLPLLEDEEDMEEQSHKYSSVPEAPVPKKLLILDGRPRDPDMINQEKVVFPKDAIKRSLINQTTSSKSKDQPVERINAMVSDPNDENGANEGNNQTTPASFVPPIEKPKNYDEKRKTFFIEDTEKIGEDLVPRLIEMDYMYFKKIDEPPSESEEEKLHPLDPFESFYQECDQSKKNVPSIPGSKVFKRKVRKLKPEEQREAEKEKMEIARKLRDPNLVPHEVLVKTDEWAHGRPVLKKQIEFEETKNNFNKEPDFQEATLDYYQLIEKNPEFTDSIMYPEKATIKRYNPQAPDTNVNTFDSMNRSELLSPVKFMLAQGPDGSIRIYQLENYQGNPLIETEAGRLSVPTNIEASQDGFRTMFRHSGNFNDTPVLEPQTSRLLLASTLDAPTHRQSEIQTLADRRVLTPDELARFLEMMKFVPDVKIELYKQSPEEIKGKSIVEQGLQFNSMAYTDRASIMKQIGELNRQGKIAASSPQTKPKITLEESVKLSMLHSDDRTKQSFLQEPKINAIKLEDTYQDKPLFQIVDGKDEGQEDEEIEKYDPVAHLQEELDKIANISDAQVPFTDISNKALTTTDDVHAQKQILKQLAKELEGKSKSKGQAIDDWMFLPNGTSMVNNSLKSEIPYKDCEWMKLSEIYKVGCSHSVQCVPFKLQSKGVVPTRWKSHQVGCLLGCSL